MSNDLELIKQLEKEIDKKLEQREFDEIDSYEANGFSINENRHVTGLNLDKIELVPLPVTLSKFQHLEKLCLYDTGITNVSFLQGLRNLISLDLRSNKITDIFHLQVLSNLSNLSLNNNKITDISFLQSLSHLTSLDLRNNQITDISFLQGLRNLTRLYLSENKITDISFLRGLSHLSILYLGYNNITDISFLQGLRNLTGLDLRKNNIFELPEAIVELGMGIETYYERVTEWEGILLSGNPLKKPPMEIIRKGKDAIKAYFKSLEGEKQALNEVKVLLVGDGAVGKTSLLKRLLEEGFDKNEPQTYGINIKPWEIKVGESEITTHLWDFGGQEIMHATHQFFLSKRSLYVLVLDGRKDEKPEYWLKHVKAFGGDSPVLVVINKIDQNPAFDVNRLFLLEKYKNIKGFFRVSCANKTGIGKFSKALGEALAKVEMLQTIWPRSWFNVKTALEKMTFDYISYEQYEKMCLQQKITNYNSQTTLMDFLNDLGVVLHFNEPALKETNVINPKWVTEAVYRVINSKELAEDKGILRKNTLREILDNKKYPQRKHDYIIELMKKFDLCYEIDEETVLIPDLLAVQESHIEFDYADALKFIIEYEFLPRSVMPRFIVNMHKNIKGELQWRTGVVLENRDFLSTAVVKADNEAKRIYIYVEGGQKRDYFAVILAALRSINKSFEKLETRELVPMPDNPKITANYKQLIRFEEEGIEYYLPGETKKKYKVKDLLGTIGKKIEEDETLQMLRTIKMTQMQREPGKKDR